MSGPTTGLNRNNKHRTLEAVAKQPKTTKIKHYQQTRIKQNNDITTDAPTVNVDSHKSVDDKVCNLFT